MAKVVAIGRRAWGWPDCSIRIGERFDILLLDEFDHPVATVETKAPYHRSTALSPNNSEYERCLAWAMFNGGKETEGFDHLNRALELAPADVHLMTDLGTAMLMLRDISLARQYAEDALRIDPTYEVARRLAETVDRIEKRFKSQ